jgi:hypothetical protein
MLGMQVSFNIWDVLINLVFSYIATVGFALTVNIPHRVIHWSGICGCAGWMVYWLVTEASGGADDFQHPGGLCRGLGRGGFG